MKATVQQHLLMMFAYDSNEEHLKEMKDVLAKYFAQKVDDEMDALWNEGKITMDMIEEWGEEYMLHHTNETNKPKKCVPDYLFAGSNRGLAL